MHLARPRVILHLRGVVLFRPLAHQDEFGVGRRLQRRVLDVARRESGAAPQIPAPLPLQIVVFVNENARALAPQSGGIGGALDALQGVARFLPGLRIDQQFPRALVGCVRVGGARGEENGHSRRRGENAKRQERGAGRGARNAPSDCAERRDGERERPPGAAERSAGAEGAGGPGLLPNRAARAPRRPTANRRGRRGGRLALRSPSGAEGAYPHLREGGENDGDQGGSDPEAGLARRVVRRHPANRRVGDGCAERDSGAVGERGARRFDRALGHQPGGASGDERDGQRDAREQPRHSLPGHRVDGERQGRPSDDDDVEEAAPPPRQQTGASGDGGSGDEKFVDGEADDVVVPRLVGALHALLRYPVAQRAPHSRQEALPVGEHAGEEQKPYGGERCE